MVENEGMVNEIISSLGTAIPASITDNRWMQDFEERLNDFSRLWNFIKSTKIEEIIKEQDCIELFEKVKAMEKDVQGRTSLNKGDIWTLDFLKGVNGSDAIAFIKMVGPLYYMIRIAADIEKRMNTLTSNLKAALFVYLFQNLYELLLENIDSCFYVYLDKKEKVKGQQHIDKFRKRFIIERRESRSQREDIGKHADAGLIHGMLKEVYTEECENNGRLEDKTLLEDTIFNKMAKKLRNSSAHLNAFYDEKINKIVFLNGDEMTMDEFISLYDKLFLFLTEWMELYLSGSKDGKAFADKIYEEMGKMLSQTEREMREIERRGDRKLWNMVVEKRWGSNIVKIKEKENKEK